MTGEGRMIRLGVIGAGRITQVAHLPVFSKTKYIELVAISDPSAALVNGVAARYGILGYTDTAEMLNSADVDAVLIAAPDRFHYALGKQAIEAGKHVLMEKPLAQTSVQAQQLADLAVSSGRKLQTGAMKRHDPGIAFAKHHIERIGEILSFSSWYRVMADRAPVESTLFPATVVDPEVRRVENPSRRIVRATSWPLMALTSSMASRSWAVPGPGSAHESATSAVTTRGRASPACATVAA